MKSYWILCLPILALGCASARVAKDVKYVSFAEVKPSQSKDLGFIEGQDCTWSLFGWRLGSEPQTQAAVVNAKNGVKTKLNPLDKTTEKGPEINAIKNLHIDNSRLSIWVVGRECINVTGKGVL